MSESSPQPLPAPPPRRKRRAWRVALLAAFALAALFVFRTARGVEVPAVVARRAPLTQRVVVSGRVTPPSQIQIGATVSGSVREVKVDEGQVVEPGAVLVELEAAELDAAVVQANAGLLAAKARLTQVLQVTAPAQSQALRQAELALEQAQRRADRAKTLSSAGAVSSVEFEDARDALLQAESRVASARAQAASSGKNGADVRAAEAAVAQAEGVLAAVKARRGLATLVSPTRALVLQRDVEPGDVASPGRALLVLARVGATRLSVEPDEKNLAFIKPGQKALASADAFPAQRFDAEVETVSPAVNPERGTVEVKLKVPHPPDYLRADMAVSVEIVVATKASAIVLPLGAVQDAASAAPFVLEARDGRAVKAPVKLGLSGEGRVEVVDGVAEGATVLVPSGRLDDGARVRAKPREP